MGLLPFRVVNTGQLKIVERLGKYNRTLEPGLRLTIPIIERVSRTVSTKQQILDIPPSSVITKDNVGVEIDAVVFYYIEDPLKAVYGIENFKNAVAYTTITNLRSTIGEMTLDEILSERKKINDKLLAVVDELTEPYGIKIINIEIKDIAPPRSVSDSMELQLTAERKKRASILTAEGDRESTVTRAEAEKKAMILQAEASRESKILNAEAAKEERLRKAEAQAEARRLEADAESKYIEEVAKAQAKAIEMVSKAIKESGKEAAVIALKQTEALIEMSKNPANKLILPNEAVSSLGSLAAVTEVLKNK